MKKPNPKFLAGAVFVVLASSIAWSVLRPKDFLYVGTLEATEVDLSSRISSVIADVPVREGEKIHRDQVVVRLAAEDLQIAAGMAERDFDRASRLYRSGSMAAEPYEHLKSRRDETALKLAWATVKAPMSGRVLTAYREPGEWVSPGMKLVTLANLEDVWAVFYVEQPMLSKLSLGKQVQGLVPEMPGRVFEGKIVRISDEAEFTPKNVQTRDERTRLVFGVKVQFSNADEALKPGMSIEARLGE